MTINLAPFTSASRVLFAVKLEPLQGARFQPTGFPGLGAATYETGSGGTSLLVESAQSMANRLETTVWDAKANDVIAPLQGISHVRIKRRDGRFLTDTILEAHRLNSPYLLEDSSRRFLGELREALGGLETGPIDRKKLAEVLLNFDVGSLIHGVFLAKKDLAGGRLRVARALSAFIEADGARVAASGGVKNDHVNPSGETKSGFGNVPFARDEYTAERITLYANLDVAQIRGYGLGEAAERLLVLLSLYKLRALLDGDLRLRAACDLRVADERIVASTPRGLELPDFETLEKVTAGAIAETKKLMLVRDAVFNDELRKARETEAAEDEADEGNGG